MKSKKGPSNSQYAIDLIIVMIEVFVLVTMFDLEEGFKKLSIKVARYSAIRCFSCLATDSAISVLLLVGSRLSSTLCSALGTHIGSTLLTYSKQCLSVT